MQKFRNFQRFSKSSTLLIALFATIFPPLTGLVSNVNKVLASEIIEIDTCLELQGLATEDTSHKIFSLTADIDCSATSISDNEDENFVAGLYNEGLGFTPIPYFEYAVFDGQGYTISNLTINRPGEAYVGLFGSSYEALITDVILENIDITGQQFVGGVAGDISRTDIIGVLVNGEVNSVLPHTGGIAGRLDYLASVQNSSFSGTITSESSSVGGIAGAVGSISSISDSYVNADITTSGFSVGGLVGELRYENIFIGDSYATGSVTGFNSVGGLVGLMNATNSSGNQVIEDTFASMVVTSENYAGGFIGAIQYPLQNPVVAYSFFDSEVAGTDTAIDYNGEALTVTNINGGEEPGYFYNPSNEPLASWNFEDVWGATEGFPYLLEFAITPEAPGVPTDLTMTPNGNSFTVTWDYPLTDGGLDFLDNYLYELELKESSSEWQSEDALFNSALGNGDTYANNETPFDQSNPSIIFGDLGVDTDYDVRVRTLGRYGLQSDWVELTSSTDSANDHTISTCEELQSIGIEDEFRLIDNYTLTGNIDCSDTINWNSGDGFEPIGYETGAFYGVLDGAGFTISDLVINRESGYNVGLFSEIQTSSAAIKNVKLTNVNILGSQYVGAVVGFADNGVFENIEVSGSVSGNEDVGGLVGELDDSFVNDITLNVTLEANVNVGGIAGYIEDTEIENVSATVVVSNPDLDDYAESIGGLVGRIADSVVRHASVNATINLETDGYGINQIGGFAGELYYDVVVEDSYSEGSIDAQINNPDGNDLENIGGFAGTICEDDPICVLRRNYSTVDINVNSGSTEDYNQIYVSRIGGFAGSAEYFYDGVIEESYASGDIQIGLIEHTGEIYHVGGFIGEIDYHTEGASIRNNYTRSNITVTLADTEVDNIGGFIGRNYSDYDLLVENNYSASNLSVSTAYEEFGDIAGFIGEDRDDSENGSMTEFKNNFRTGNLEITGAFVELEVAGFVGRSNGVEENYSNNFLHQGGDFDYCFNGDLEWGTDACTEVDNDGVFKASNNEPLASWDFENIWDLDEAENDGFPILRMIPRPADDDNDGISDEEENAAPNDGDANGDEVLDSEQQNVASFVNTITSSYTVLAVDDSCTITSAVIDTESENGVQDSGYTYPVGMLNFTIECEEGFTTEVNIFEFGEDDDSLVLRKYKDDAYFMVEEAIIERVTIGEQSALQITYSVTDGGELDLDGEVNGIIVDPVGLAALAVGAPNTGLGGSRIK